MDISMDIHETSVDMYMDMDVIFHIHGNPAYHNCIYSASIIQTKNKAALQKSEIPGKT